MCDPNITPPSTRSREFLMDVDDLGLDMDATGTYPLPIMREIIANDENIVKTKPSPKLTLLPLVILIFYEVSGGPFGVEVSVKSGSGPLLALLGFLIFWSIPEALVTAKLATSFPENSGYVVWISSSFVPSGDSKKGSGNGLVVLWTMLTTLSCFLIT